MFDSLRKKIIVSFLTVPFMLSKIEAQSTTLQVADSLYTVGEYSNAIKKYMSIDTKDQYTLLQIAKSHKAKGTYGDALEFYRKSVLKDTSNSIVSLEYGKLLMTTKKSSLADSVFTKLVAKHPQNPNFLYNLGLTKETLKDSVSIQFYKKAFDLDNSHQKSCYKVAKHFLQLREYDSVAKYANIGLSHYENNVELISILGQNYFRKERFDKAIPYFLQLIELNYKSEFIYRSLAISYHKEYEYNDALKYYKTLLTYDSQNAKIYNTIAEIYSKLQNHREAEKNYLIAIELLKYDLDKEYYRLAMSCRFQDKWEEAIRYMKKALKENPDNFSAQYELAVFADAYYKDPEKKLSYYNRYIQKFGQKDSSPKDKKRSFMRFFEEKVQKRIHQLEQEIATKDKHKKQ